MFEAVANSAEVIAGVLGIAATLVAIIVELAATRYNHRITDLFIREPLNLIVLSFFVITTLACVWIVTVPEPDRGLWVDVTMGAITLALVLLLPYFVYVLSFISPNNVVKRISRRAFREMVPCSSSSQGRRRTAVADALEELQDVMRNAIERGDRTIAIGCVDTMADLLISYQTRVPPLPDAWYRVDKPVQNDPDFASLEPSALARIAEHRTWFEYKSLSLLAKAVRLASPRSPDAAFQIFVRTRDLALKQRRNSDHFDLCIKTFNTYLRSVINNGDQRSNFFALNQYRKDS
jgi:hypothetical protein